MSTASEYYKARPVDHPSAYSQIFCGRCKSKMRRLARRGFLQKRIYSFFGYYPWECPVCRTPVLIKKKHQHRSSSEHGMEP